MELILNNAKQSSIILVKPISKFSQKLLNWFVFFLAFPSIEIFDNSITFYLFIGVAIRIGTFWETSFKGKSLLLLFLLSALVSTIVAPDMKRQPGMFASVKILIQYTYWIFVGLFFISQKKRINLIELSKWILYGLIAATIGFYLINFKFSSSIFSLEFGASRNSFVFNLLCSIPLSFYYLVHALGKKKAGWFIPVFLMIMLLTGGRSGAVLIIIQMLLVMAIVYPSVQKSVRMLLPFFAIIYVYAQSGSAQIYLNVLADQVESFNPRFANLLRGEEDGDLTSDKSWLVRKLMVDKGIEIFKEYPVFGIGPTNFKYFDSPLSTLYSYERLSGQNSEFFNSRSAHNSYIELLSEMGIPGITIMLSLLIIPLIIFFRQFFIGRLNLQYLPFVSLLGIAIHFYAIAALTGAVAWLIIGMAWGVLNNNKRLK